MEDTLFQILFPYVSGPATFNTGAAEFCLLLEAELLGWLN